MNIKTILALTDFSTPSEHGLERAALLAIQHQAGLRIMYGAEKPDRKFLDPFARLQQRARQLGRRHGINVEAVAHTGSMLDDAVKHARRADLLVLDHRLHRPVLKFWRGTTLDHLMRHCRCPVLVVKRASSTAYERMLIAIDFTPKSKELVRYASGFGTGSELELFHASSAAGEARLDLAGGRTEAIEAYRRAAFQNAHDRLLRLSNSFDTRRNRVTAVAGCADPARQIAVQQDAIRADLVVVGKHSRSTVVDFLCGSIARRLINFADSDVLVVSDDWMAPSALASKPGRHPVFNG